jgi:YggT family protein
MLTTITLLNMAFSLVFYIILIQVILSWLVSFNIVNLHQPIVYQIWSGLNRLTEPLYRPIRRLLPDMGGLDLAPLIVIFGLIAVQRVIFINFVAAY